MHFRLWVFIAGVIYLGLTTSSHAGCTVKDRVSLAQAGYGKAEINAICASQDGKTVTPAAKTKKPAQAPQKKLVKHDVNSLDGTYTLVVDCSPYSGTSHDIVLKAGSFTGRVDAGEDNLYVQGTVTSEGVISGYGTGTHVFAEYSGRVTDWENAEGRGTATAGGEADCVGSWSAKRIK